MTVLMQLTNIEHAHNQHPYHCQLTAVRVDETWGKLAMLTIPIVINPDVLRNICGAYSPKQACFVLDAFLKQSDHLCWVAQEELTHFAHLSTQYLRFRIRKNSSVLSYELRKQMNYHENTDLETVRKLLAEINANQLVNQSN